jgi:uncharacterized RDD family membrane protein YckC
VNEYAGVVTRTLALALDALALNLGIALVTAIVGLALSVFGERATDPDAAAVLGAGCAWLLVAGAYFAGFWTLTGQTPGMRVLRLEVAAADGGELRLGRALRRLVGMVLAALPLMAGYALILVDARRQGFHDKLAGTVVRYAPRPQAMPYVRATAAPSRRAAAPPG